MKEQVECSDDPEMGIECTLFFLPQKEVDQKNAVRRKDPLSSLQRFAISNAIIVLEQALFFR